MKQIQLPMVDNAKWQRKLRVAKDDSGATILSQDFDLDESFNCAGYDLLNLLDIVIDYMHYFNWNFISICLLWSGEENVDACEGDGGGPLVCPKLDNSNRLEFWFWEYKCCLLC